MSIKVHGSCALDFLQAPECFSLVDQRLFSSRSQVVSFALCPFKRVQWQVEAGMNSAQIVSFHNLVPTHSQSDFAEKKYSRKSNQVQSSSRIAHESHKYGQEDMVKRNWYGLRGSPNLNRFNRWFSEITEVFARSGQNTRVGPCNPCLIRAHDGTV